LEVLALIAGAVELMERSRLDRLSGRLRPHSGSMREHWVIALDDRKLPLRLKDGQAGVPFDGVLSVGAGAETRVRSLWMPGDRIWRGTVGERLVTAQVDRQGHRLSVSRRGISAAARLLTVRAAAIDELMPVKEPPDTSKYLLCPMPGMVVSIAVSEGQTVEPGEALATVEAMKMENVLRAERECVVAAIKVLPGDSLAVDEVIMEFQ